MLFWKQAGLGPRAQREQSELQAIGAAGTILKPFSPKDLPEQLRAIWRELP